MPHSDDLGPAKRVPHRRMSREQRLADARERLAGRLDRLRAAIDREHPVQDCLPLPTLDLPAEPGDLDQLIDEVRDNLFTEQGHRAQRWIDARAQCSHLAEEQVNAVHEMVFKWYHLLNAARHHLDDRPLYDLDWAEETFDRWIPASSPNPNPGRDADHDAEVAERQRPASGDDGQEAQK